MTLRIMPLGDSITRGSYLALYDSGPLAGQPIGLPNPAGGGWRKPLQDKLRAAGVACEFVGELEFGAYGRDGVVDPAFSPRHHGLAGSCMPPCPPPTCSPTACIRTPTACARSPMPGGGGCRSEL